MYRRFDGEILVEEPAERVCMIRASDLLDLLEACLSAPRGEREGAISKVIAMAKRGIEEGSHELVASVVRHLAAPTLDYTSLQSLLRLRTRIGKQTASAAGTHKIKLAVLSTVTTEQLIPLMELFLWTSGIQAEIYAADYGVVHQEILDPASHLYEFQPDFIYLALTWRDLSHTPDLFDEAVEIDRRVEHELGEWSLLWKRAHEGTGAQILQDNFVPPRRLLGNHELRHPASLGRHCARVNAALAERAPGYVLIHDVDHLAANWGRRAFCDERFYHHAKLPASPEGLVDYAHSVASVIGAQLGRAKKCLVLDLDNTLWGGVIGDDGLAGIRLGSISAEAEAFVAFQHYVLGLSRRGIILAVCSANEETLAKQVFIDHPEMVLKLEDISSFVANWESKAANIERIAQVLNIGLSEIVFLDDDPAQRALVRRMLPKVSVPQVSGDPSEYAAVLERMRYFQVASLGSEDLERTELYRANAARRAVEHSSGSVGEFLQSLDMRAHIAPIEDASLERSVQLINKTNQFNLTTRRYTTADILGKINDERWYTCTIRLYDRFGGNGLVSVLLACKTNDVLEIDTWVMSCRVLRRGVEHLLMNHVYEATRDAGLSTIRGEFIPTERNALVARHYAGLGFHETHSNQDGATFWELPVNASWSPAKNFIRVINDGG